MQVCPIIRASSSRTSRSCADTLSFRRFKSLRTRAKMMRLWRKLSNSTYSHRVKKIHHPFMSNHRDTLPRIQLLRRRSDAISHGRFLSDFWKQACHPHDHPWDFDSWVHGPQDSCKATGPTCGFLLRQNSHNLAPSGSINQLVPLSLNALSFV